MFVVNKTNNDVIGYSITTPQGTQHTVRPLWSVHIPEEQEIIEVQSHRHSGNAILSCHNAVFFFTKALNREDTLYSMCTPD